MGSLSIWHWLIVLLVVTLVFGTRKLRGIGSDLGGAVKDFKESMHSDNETTRQNKGEGQTAEIEAGGNQTTNV